jgi:hypothetical protein
MIQSRIFVAAAILAGIALILAGLLIAPFNASARAAATEGVDVASDRIGGAFSIASKREPAAEIAAAAALVFKGDLGAASICANAVWPNIDPSCLARTDGSASHPVRLITIGYQSGDATTILVRVPAGEVASR